VHFAAEYVFFSVSGLLPLNIIFDHESYPFPKGYKNMRKDYFPALATSRSLNIEINIRGNGLLKIFKIDLVQIFGWSHIGSWQPRMGAGS
jgi:hypothetical protein